MTVEEIITEFVQTNLVREVGKARIDPGDDLIGSGIVDSLGIQKLLAFLESHFSIEVLDDELLPENFETVAQIGSFVRRKALKV